MAKPILPAELNSRTRTSAIDLRVYTLEAIMKSAYRFTGRCFLHLEQISHEIVQVQLRPKQANDDPDAALGDFLNDLVDQRLRTLIASETVAIRNLVMAHALSRTALIRADLETADPALDPELISRADLQRFQETSSSPL